MKYLLLFTLVMGGCNSIIIYPKGGYPYPKQIAPLDLNQYYYPIKDVVSKRDSLPESYAYIFFQAYDEPNISLKPQPIETFRLSYGEPLAGETIITITEKRNRNKKRKGGA